MCWEVFSPNVCPHESVCIWCSLKSEAALAGFFPKQTSSCFLAIFGDRDRRLEVLIENDYRILFSSLALEIGDPADAKDSCVGREVWPQQMALHGKSSRRAPAHLRWDRGHGGNRCCCSRCFRNLRRAEENTVGLE